MYLSNALLLAVALALPAAPPAPLSTFSLDPVALARGEQVPGKAELGLDRYPFRYLFSSAENRAAFEREPERFEVQVGGSCARMGPLSGRGYPELHAVHGGRIYVFASESCRKTFLADPAAVLESPDPVPSGDADAMRRGRALLERAVAAMGGAPRVDTVRSLRTHLAGETQSRGETVATSMTRTFVFPHRLRLDETFDEYHWGHAGDAKGGFFFSSEGADPMHPVQHEALVRELYRDPLALLKARHREDFVAVAIASSKIDARAVEQVAVALAGATSVLSIDAETGRLLGQSYRARGPRGLLGTLEIVFADFVTVRGLQLPRSSTARFDGEPWPERSRTFTSIEIDGGIDGRLFEMGEATR